MCVLYEALDPLVSWPRCNHSQWYGHCRMDVINQCGPLGVRPNRAANVTYSMFSYNGWGTVIVLQVLETALTLLRKCNILSKLYCWTMIVTIYITSIINCHDGIVIYFTKTLEFIYKLAWVLFVLNSLSHRLTLFLFMSSPIITNICTV